MLVTQDEYKIGAVETLIAMGQNEDFLRLKD